MLQQLSLCSPHPSPPPMGALLCLLLSADYKYHRFRSLPPPMCDANQSSSNLWRQFSEMLQSITCIPAVETATCCGHEPEWMWLFWKSKDGFNLRGLVTCNGFSFSSFLCGISHWVNTQLDFSLALSSHLKTFQSDRFGSNVFNLAVFPLLSRVAVT